VSTRPYESPLRAQQAERKRERILEALVAEFSEGGDDVAVARVAERAGVSRTVACPLGYWGR